MNKNTKMRAKPVKKISLNLTLGDISAISVISEALNCNMTEAIRAALLAYSFELVRDQVQEWLDEMEESDAELFNPPASLERQMASFLKLYEGKEEGDELE